MKTNAFLLLLSLSLTVISCTNKAKNTSENKASTTEEVDAYSMTAVIAVHDEVMPKMGEISLLIDRLKPLAD